MQHAIKEKGHTLFYLPTYSPDLNPIEKKWEQTKAIRRKIGGTVEQLLQNLNV